MSMHKAKKWIIAVSLLAAVAAAGDTIGRLPINRLYDRRHLATYLDLPTVEFVRPGLTIQVQSAAIASDGTITATYTLSDPSGLPLDAAGATTPGAISLSFLGA